VISAGLPAGAAAGYGQHGFVLLSAAVDPAVLASLTADCDAVLSNSANRSSIEDFGGAVSSCHVPMLGYGSRATDELVVSDALCEVAERLTASEVFLDPLAVEAVSYGSVVPWHRDASTETLGVKFAMYLQPLLGEEALLILPGSHRKPWQGAEEVDRTGQAVALEPLPGDLVAFDLRLWHCNRGRGPRNQWTATYLTVPREPDEEAATRAWLREGENYDKCELGRRRWLNVDWIRSQRANPRWSRWIDSMEALGRHL